MMPISQITGHKEESLTVLVDYCKRSFREFGGDDYEEIVLYQNNNDGSYVFHDYKKTGKMLDESDIAYASDENDYKAIMNKITELGLISYKDQKGDVAKDIKHSCKFKTDEGYVRITSDNLPKDKENILFELGNLIYSLTK